MLWVQTEKELSLVYLEALQIHHSKDYSSFDFNEIVYDLKSGWEFFLA